MKKTISICLTLLLIIQLLSIAELNINSSTIELPKTPVGVSATATDKSITVTWSAVEGAINYEVKINGNVNATSQTTYTYTGLEQDTIYEYSVRAKNNFGSSAYSGAQTIKTFKIISVPTGINSKSLENSITLSWNAVNGATSYEINSGGLISSTTLTTYTFVELTSDTAYSYSIRTVEDNEKSAFSSAINVNTLKTVITPNQPVEQTQPETPNQPVEPTQPVEPIEPVLPDDLAENNEIVDAEIINTINEEVDTIDEAVDTINNEDNLNDELSLNSKPIIINPETDFIHMSNSDFTLLWLNSDEITADKIGINIYDQHGYLIFSKKNINADSFEYLIPGEIFAFSGKYIIELLVDNSNNEIGYVNQKVMTVLNTTEARAITNMYTKYTNKTYIIKGELEVLDFDQLVEYGFQWGDNIFMDNLLKVDSIDENGMFSKRIPEVKIDTKYYYRAYLRKRNGDYVFGEMLTIQTNELETIQVPNILSVLKEDYDKTTQLQHFTVKTELGADELIFTDQMGSVMSYKTNYNDVEKSRVWEIDRFYPTNGIYEEEVYAVSQGIKSVANKQLSVVGVLEYNPIVTSNLNQEYTYYMSNKKILNLEGTITTKFDDDNITEVMFCLEGALDNEVEILTHTFNNESIDLNQELLSINPHEFPINTTGIYTMLIYASTTSLEGQQVLIGDIIINTIEQIQFIDFESNYNIFSDVAVIQLSGSILCLDNSYITEVNVLTEDNSETIYIESFLSNVHREIIDVDEEIEINLNGSDYQIIRLLILLSDGTIIRKNIKVSKCKLIMEVPESMNIDKELYVRIYTTFVDGSRKLYDSTIDISINDTDIATLDKNQLRTLKEGSVVITATINSANNEIVTSQILNITKNDN